MNTTTSEEPVAAGAGNTPAGPPARIAPPGPPPGRHVLITKSEMLRKVGRAWPTVWAWICQTKFPQPVCPDPETGAVMWVLAEVDAWIEDLMASNRKSYPSRDNVIGNARHDAKKAKAGKRRRGATKPAPAR